MDTYRWVAYNISYTYTYKYSYIPFKLLQYVYLFRIWYCVCTFDPFRHWDLSKPPYYYIKGRETGNVFSSSIFHKVAPAYFIQIFTILFTVLHLGRLNCDLRVLYRCSFKENMVCRYSGFRLLIFLNTLETNILILSIYKSDLFHFYVTSM